MNLPKQETRLTTNNTRIIPLTQGQFAVVDVDDYEWLSKFKWQAQWNRKTKSFYAIRTSSAANGAKPTTVRMHREIMGLDFGDPRLVDHIKNADTLNNRRSNLRIATACQNQHNRRPRRDSTSGMKGITPFQGKWIVELRANGKRHYIGYYPTLESARNAYVEAAEFYHGEFANTEPRTKT